MELNFGGGVEVTAAAALDWESPAITGEVNEGQRVSWFTHYSDPFILTS